MERGIVYMKTFGFNADQVANIRNSLMPSVMGRELPTKLYYEIFAERLNVLIACHGYLHDSPQSVLQEVVSERAAQDEEWGGPSHDDTHTQFHWTKFIREHADRSVRGQARDDFRQQMIRVAALAVAAVQSFDRIGKEIMVHGKPRTPCDQDKEAQSGGFDGYGSTSNGEFE